MGNIQNVKEIAKKKGISYAFICRSIGKSHGYLAEIQARDGDIPDKMLEPIANALGVHVSDITGTAHSGANTSSTPTVKMSVPQEIANTVKAMSDDELRAVVSQERVAFYGEPEREIELDRATLEWVAAKALATTHKQTISIMDWARNRASDDQLLRVIACATEELRRRQEK